MNKPKQGDKVSFWQTIKGKPTLRTGVFLGYANFNGKAVVETENSQFGSYKHYVPREKLIYLKENDSPRLPL